MPLNDPTITATCDECSESSDPMELCCLAGGGWDERYVPDKLKKRGWKIDGDRTICPDCQHGEYGICQQCLEPIAEKRLAAVPWAARCMRCEELGYGQEKEIGDV